MRKDLPDIKILDEKDKRLHQKSEPVTFPLDPDLKQKIYDAPDYLEMSQVEEIAEKYGLTFLYRDFRPGFREGQNEARELGLYMQKYCRMCVFGGDEIL